MVPNGGQNPNRSQNGLNDVDSRKDVPFAVKIATSHPLIQAP